MKLCTGEMGATAEGVRLHYQGCPIHRLVSGGWMQCGDIVEGTGLGSIAAIEGGRVRDESFSVDFGVPDGGVVGYSSGGPHGNGSQFFITFGPCDWMQNTFVGFGRVIVGNRVLQVLERQRTENQRPSQRIIIADSGIER